LVPTLSKIVIEVPRANVIEGLAIARDGVAVGSAQWGATLPIDPGRHTVSAHAARRVPWSTEVVVPTGGGTTVVTVPALTVESTPSDGVAATASRAAAVLDARANPAPDEAPRRLGLQRTLALVAGGVGIAGIGVGTVFGIKAMTHKNEADKACNGTGCVTDEGVAAGNDAHSAGNVATIGMIVGGIGVAGAVTLWLTAPQEGPRTQVGLGPGSVQIQGVF
jgi:hypothetical protein